jgi:hypothetical protein
MPVMITMPRFYVARRKMASKKWRGAGEHGVRAST